MEAGRPTIRAQGTWQRPAGGTNPFPPGHATLTGASRGFIPHSESPRHFTCRPDNDRSPAATVPRFEPHHSTRHEAECCSALVRRRGRRSQPSAQPTPARRSVRSRHKLARSLHSFSAGVVAFSGNPSTNHQRQPENRNAEIVPILQYRLGASSNRLRCGRLPQVAAAILNWWDTASRSSVSDIESLPRARSWRTLVHAAASRPAIQPPIRSGSEGRLSRHSHTACFFLRPISSAA